MKRIEILPAVYDAIEERGMDRSKWFWLCYKNGKICCEPGGAIPQPEIWFCKLTTKQIYDGLSSSEWSTIENRIFNILNQKGLL